MQICINEFEYFRLASVMSVFNRILINLPLFCFILLPSNDRYCHYTPVS